MKRKLLTVLMITMFTCLTGCGSTAETETEVASQPQEETVAESVETTVEEAEVIEEESVEEVTEESAEAEAGESEEVIEEPQEVVEKTYERKDFTMNYVVTNFKPSETDYDYSLKLEEVYSSNDYLATDVMAELESRGYNIANFVVTYEVALNDEGSWIKDDEAVPFHSFEGINDKYVKLTPIFIKYGEIDDSKLVYDFTLASDEDGSQLKFDPSNNPKAYEMWYEIFNCIIKMKSDENFVGIDFKIPDTIYSRNLINAMRPHIEDDENIAIKEFTLNDWYNGMLYALFVEQSIDLDGYFDDQSIMY